MVEGLIAGFSALVALGALVVSFLAHRNQAAANEGLRERERTIAARESALELREARVQASMIELRADSAQSPLHTGWTTHRLEIVNPSNQPVTDVSATYRGTALAGVSGSIGSGTSRLFTLPPAPNATQADQMLHDIVLMFTDAAGIRWRRDGAGSLRRGVRQLDGRWAWHNAEQPIIADSRAMGWDGHTFGPPEPLSGAAMEPSRRTAASLWLTAVVVGAGIALLVILLV